MNKEEIIHLETMISLHKKNLYTLEEMLARYGSDQPLHLVNSVTMEREAIARYSKQIESLTATGQGNRKIKYAVQLAKAALFCGDERMSSRPSFCLYTQIAAPLS